MTSQAEKYHKSMAGEYFVAAQLHRLGIAASVTYGNAKSADVIAFNHETGKVVVVEVKSSSAGLWPVGSRVPAPSPQPWVFVHLPTEVTESPVFYVLTQEELHIALAPAENAYMARFKAKHGVEYGSRAGVAAAKRAELLPFKDAWHTIAHQIAA